MTHLADENASSNAPKTSLIFLPWRSRQDIASVPASDAYASLENDSRTGGRGRRSKTNGDGVRGDLYTLSMDGKKQAGNNKKEARTVKPSRGVPKHVLEDLSVHRCVLQVLGRTEHSGCDSLFLLTRKRHS